MEMKRKRTEMKAMDVRGFNKDTISRTKSQDGLLGFMPSDRRFCKTEFAVSLEGMRPGALYIGHVTDDQAAEVVRALMATGGTFVRCGSTGRVGHPHERKGSVSILQLQPSYKRVKEKWGEIIHAFAGDQDLPGKIVDGDIPPHLRSFFGFGIADYCSSLAILCQGYLAVYAEYCSGKSTKPKGEVAIALGEMRWDLVPKDLETGRIRTNLAEKWSETGVQNPDWWAAVFGGNIDFRMLKQKEWGVEKESDDSLERVEKLVQMINKRKRIKDPMVVAIAYRALSRNLGGNP